MSSEGETGLEEETANYGFGHFASRVAVFGLERR
jgi:hypothetical protein